MRHFIFQALAALLLALAPQHVLHADQPNGDVNNGLPKSDTGITTSDTVGDCDFRTWWLPDCSCGKMTRPRFDQYLPGSPRDAVRPDECWSLIEQAESLLETPRRQLQHGIRSTIDDGLLTETPVVTQNMFSHTWSDGAPLLLFDWSGKSHSSGPSNLKLDGVKRVADASTATDWADLSSKIKLREHDARLDPTVPNTWETDESLKLPVAGSVFVFGQLGASTPDVEQRQYKWLGKTGLGMKLKPWLLQEVQVRGGPAVRYDDTEKLSPGQSPERSELYLEAVTKVPLPMVGPINVEYTGYTIPAGTAADRNAVNQDVKFALPFNSGGQFHVGAKYKWETATATPWMDRMQLYLGVQNKW